MAKKNVHVAATRTLISEKDDYQEKLLNVNYNSKLLKMIEYATEFDVPIMQNEGIAFLIMLLKVKKPMRILEIGSAIGFSSSVMALNSDATIDTIERDSKMIAQCKKNHEELGLAERIRLIEGDALNTIEIVKDNKYDLIFIDAAKAKGKHLGRPKAVKPVNLDEVVSEWKNGKITARQAYTMLGVSKSVFYRWCKY